MPYVPTTPVAYRAGVCHFWRVVWCRLLAPRPARAVLRSPHPYAVRCRGSLRSHRQCGLIRSQTRGADQVSATGYIKASSGRASGSMWAISVPGVQISRCSPAQNSTCPRPGVTKCARSTTARSWRNRRSGCRQCKDHWSPCVKLARDSPAKARSTNCSAISGLPSGPSRAYSSRGGANITASSGKARCRASFRMPSVGLRSRYLWPPQTGRAVVLNTVFSAKLLVSCATPGSRARYCRWISA